MLRESTIPYLLSVLSYIFIWALGGWEGCYWSASRPGRFTSCEMTWAVWIYGWVKLRVHLDIIPSRNRSPICQSHYIDWGAEIVQLVQRLRYGLDGPVIESRWRRDFPHPERPWGPPSPLCNGYRVFPGGKAAGAWRWPSTPPQSSAEAEGRVEVYICSPSGPSWPVLGRTFTISAELRPILHAVYDGVIKTKCKQN